MSLPPVLEQQLRQVAPELLDGDNQAAQYYASLARAAADGDEVAHGVAQRVAAAATLLEHCLVAHGAAPDGEEILRADLYLALAAEIAADIGDAGLQRALADAVMEVVTNAGAGIREHLGAVVCRSVAFPAAIAATA